MLEDEPSDSSNMLQEEASSKILEARAPPVHLLRWVRFGLRHYCTQISDITTHIARHPLLLQSTHPNIHKPNIHTTLNIHTRGTRPFCAREIHTPRSTTGLLHTRNMHKILRF